MGPVDDDGRGGAEANAMSLCESANTGIGWADALAYCESVVSNGEVDTDTFDTLLVLDLLLLFVEIEESGCANGNKMPADTIWRVESVIEFKMCIEGGVVVHCVESRS